MLAIVIEYVVWFPFFSTVDKHGCWLVHSAGLEHISIAVSILFKRADEEVRLLAGHPRQELHCVVICVS